ncbi:TRAP transporter small permease [Pelagibacterium montanilacus]|uniref:TRAP transporter small permease n=1 Tax=Pelagibacterium montanilacus TaxID=2185280 RepID=UPI000F8EF32D|nr:TRAP transporter small permease [Pelagibacterium montanilacus]
MLSRALGFVARTLLVVASVLAMGLAFVVVFDVIGRSVFNRPLRGTPEIVASAIVVICYLQVTYAIVSGGMMQVTLITDAMPQRLRSLLAALASLLGVVLFFFLMRGSYTGFVNAWTFGSFEGEGALRIPIWPERLTVFVGTALAMVAYILLTLQHLKAVATGREAPLALAEEYQDPNHV